MTILIAHRGNIDRPAPEYENKPRYIAAALSSYDQKLHCEIDVWYLHGEFYLGHDGPTYGINETFLMNARLWCHAKNLAAFEVMLKNPLIHCFWHQEDDFVLTSRGYIWTYPGKPLTSNSICVMPELSKEVQDLSNVAGICSDHLEKYLK